MWRFYDSHLKCPKHGLIVQSIKRDQLYVWYHFILMHIFFNLLKRYNLHDMALQTFVALIISKVSK